jgi:hypothetical protein
VPDNIPPIPYESAYAVDLRGENVQIAGWGMTFIGLVARFMEAATLTVLSNDDCTNRANEATRQLDHINEKYFCSVAVPYAVMGDVSIFVISLFRYFVIYVKFEN